MAISRNLALNVKEKVLALIRDNSELGEASPSVGIEFLAEGLGIKVSVAKPFESNSILPAVIDGVPVRVEVVGTTSAFD